MKLSPGTLYYPEGADFGDWKPVKDRYEQLPTGIYVPPDAYEARIKRMAQAALDYPTAVDLFAGAGGFSLGLEMAGFWVRAACEHDISCMCTYLCNLGSPETVIHPLDLEAVEQLKKYSNHKAAKKARLGGTFERKPDGTWRYTNAGTGSISSPKGTNSQGGEYEMHPCEHYYFGDVRYLKGARVLTDLGLGPLDVCLVVGGPPCQGFSTAGRRDVMDPRNSLVFEFGRLVIEINPQFMMMENVPGIVNMTTPEGIPVVDALASMLSAGGWSTREAIRKSILEHPDARVAARTHLEREGPLTPRNSQRTRKNLGDDILDMDDEDGEEENAATPPVVTAQAEEIGAAVIEQLSLF